MDLVKATPAFKEKWRASNKVTGRGSQQIFTSENAPDHQGSSSDVRDSPSLNSNRKAISLDQMSKYCHRPPKKTILSNQPSHFNVPE